MAKKKKIIGPCGLFWFQGLVDLLTLLIHEPKTKGIEFSCMIWSLWSMPTTPGWILNSLNEGEHSTTSNPIHLSGQNSLMVSFLSSQGPVSIEYQISMYLGLCQGWIFPRFAWLFSIRLNGSGCGVTSMRKYLSYAWTIKAFFVDFVPVDSSLTSLILLCNFMCKFPLPLNCMTFCLISSSHWCKVQELFSSHWCIVDIYNLAWLYLFWPMNDI